MFEYVGDHRFYTRNDYLNLLYGHVNKKAWTLTIEPRFYNEIYLNIVKILAPTV